MRIAIIRVLKQLEVLLWAIAFALLSSTASTSNATSLACRQGIKERTFIEARYTIDNRWIFHQRLQSWAEQQTLSMGGVGGKDPESGDVDQTDIFQSRFYGVVIHARSSNQSSEAIIRVRNNCWAKTEDWRPYWQALQNQMSDWGYLQTPD
jgi:hypothetical protein